MTQEQLAKATLLKKEIYEAKSALDQLDPEYQKSFKEIFGKERHTISVLPEFFEDNGYAQRVRDHIERLEKNWPTCRPDLTDNG